MRVLAVDQEFQNMSKLLEYKTIEEAKELTGFHGTIINPKEGQVPSWGFVWFIETDLGLKWYKDNLDTTD